MPHFRVSPHVRRWLTVTAPPKEGKGCPRFPCCGENDQVVVRDSRPRPRTARPSAGRPRSRRHPRHVSTAQSISQNSCNHCIGRKEDLPSRSPIGDTPNAPTGNTTTPPYHQSTVGAFRPVPSQGAGRSLFPPHTVHDHTTAWPCERMDAGSMRVILSRALGIGMSCVPCPSDHRCPGGCASSPLPFLSRVRPHHITTPVAASGRRI